MVYSITSISGLYTWLFTFLYKNFQLNHFTTFEHMQTYNN